MRDRPWLSLLVSLLLVTVVAVAAGAATGQARAGAVGGQITDAVTGSPLPSAYVHVYTPDGQYHGSWYADTQGEWMISLSEGAWKLRFSAGFHLDEYWNDKPDLASADELLVPVAPLLDVDASLARSPQAHLKGTVVDGETGAPVAGVQVTACDPVLWNAGPYAYTAADGTYDLAVQPGTWGLCFDRHGYARVYYEHQPASAAATTFTLADGDEVSGVDETLPRSAVVVYCSARDVDDALVPGIEVSLLDAADGHTVRSATTGADGTCVLDLGDLLGGRFKLLQHDPSGAFADQYYNYGSGGVTSFAAAATITPELGAWYAFSSRLYDKRTGEIRGRTLDAAGRPVGGVSVWVSGGGETVSDAAGNYSLPGLRVSAASSFTVAFNQADPFGPYLPAYYDAVEDWRDAQRVPVAPGQTVTVDSRLYRATDIAGTVSGPGGPLAGIEVSLYDAGGTVVRSWTTPASGAYAFTRLWPGDYRLKFDDLSTWDSDHLPGHQDAYSGGAASLAEAAVIRVDGVAGGTITQNATLEPWAGVQVRAVSDIEPCPVIGGLDVTLYDAGLRPVASTNVVGSGGYLFPRLPLGTYYVSAGDPRGVYRGEAYEDVASPDAATPLVLTRESSKAVIVMHLTPIRGVTPDFGALPDGSAATASLRLGIAPQSIASSGDTTLVCGAGAGSERGCYVFQRGDAGWARRDLLPIPSPSAWVVDIDGDLAAICAQEGPDHALVNGRLYVYRRQGGAWTLEATLRPEPDEFSLGFGSSVAVSGETIVVGAPRAWAGYTRAAGAAYVYAHSAAGWTEQARIAGDAVRDRRFGARVALDGDRALIATADETGDPVAVFERSAGAWQPAGGLVLPFSLSYGAQYGAAVALQGDRALVGAPGQGTEGGAVYVFDKLAAGWTLSGELAAADGQPHDLFGAAVDLQDGEALVGAPGKGNAVFQYPDGGAYLFRDDGGVWRQDAEMEPVLGQSPARFGSCLALAGRDLFVGSPGELRADLAAGRVHVFSPYVTDVDTALVADAGHGVLVNDVGPEGLTLSAELVGGPEHGSVELGVDGSFVYTPAAAYVGPDQFTYRAVSGDWQSDPATVTITVRALSGPALSAAGVPAGWVKAAPTVELSATAPGGVAAIEYRRGDAEVWDSYAAPITVKTEGVSEFATRSRDVFGNASAGSFTIRLDRQRPRPKASAATARRGRTCTLRYSVADAVPGSPTASVRIVVRDARGRLKWSGRQYGRPVNKALTCKFRCTLARGTYRFFVYATDQAGNPQAAVASNRLVVR